MRRFIVGILAIIGAITLLVSLTVFFSLHRTGSSLPLLSTEDSLVLSLTLGDHPLSDQPNSEGLISFVQTNPLSVQAIVEGINQAAKDDRVKGIFLTLENITPKTGTIQEIRDALKAFKATGKFIYVYADTFGTLSNGTLNYYLAAPATKIWMMPLGTLNFMGMMVEVPFAKKALDDLKIQPQFGRREEYKAMTESATEPDFTPPHRENMQRLLDTLTSQIVTDVAADRNLEANEVRKMLDTGPHTPNNAVALRMIDQVGYKDQVKDAIEKVLGKKPTFYPFDSYTQTLKSSKGEKIAIIYASGMIAKGQSAWNPLLDDAVADAREIAKSIQEAREDDSIKAIILRVDSPGGTPVASELIGHEVDQTKPKKPVIVSMSNYAASGGYWVACNANKIVAHPGTITGSIGVFAGKMVTQDFWEHYGVHWGEIHNGDNAPIWSSNQKFSESGQQKFNEYLDQVYDMFLEKVAHGRGLSPEKVRQVAKGQVWTGAEAKENGLIDALGGLPVAIDIAKKEAGLATDAPITLIHLPASKSFMSFLFDRHRTSGVETLARYPSLRLVLQKLDKLLTPPQVEMRVEELG